MPNSRMFYVVCLTPPGRGAIATIRAEGPGAVAAVEAEFRRDGQRSALLPDQIIVGRFGGRDGEEVVVCRRDETAVEIHCHGGRAAAAMIEATLIAAGGRTKKWRDWVSDRCADDPVAAAAWTVLANARTARTAATLLDQHQGAWQREMLEIHKLIDRGEMKLAHCRVSELRARLPLGRHLTQPWSVVLAGRPNVGKSSLLNALAGYCRAIVHHAPGTTRDAVTLTTAVDGWPVELCDTAGLRVAMDAVEQAGIEKTRDRLARADLVILVADHGEPWSDEDRRLFDKNPGALAVYNKCDRPRAAGRRPPGLDVSALQCIGIDALLEAVARRLVPTAPPPGAAVPFTDEHAEIVRQLSQQCLPAE